MLCVSIAVVDLETGRVFDGPFGKLPFATLAYDEATMEPLTYQDESSLLVARGCPNSTDCGVWYYNWTGQRFKLVRVERKLGQ